MTVVNKIFLATEMNVALTHTPTTAKPDYWTLLSWTVGEWYVF